MTNTYWNAEVYERIGKPMRQWAQQVIDDLWKISDDPTDTLSPRAAGIRDRRTTTLRGLFLDAGTQEAVRGTRFQ